MIHAIKAGLLIDGHGGDPIKDAILLIEGKRIIAAGTARSVKIPGGAEIIDAADKTLMPGLIDTHAQIIANTMFLEINDEKENYYYQ